MSTRRQKAKRAGIIVVAVVAAYLVLCTVVAMYHLGW